MTQKQKFENIRIRAIDKKRLDSLLKHIESYADAVSMLLWCYQKPKLDRGQNIFRNRTLSPLITDAEEAQIIDTMRKSVGD